MPEAKVTANDVRNWYKTADTDLVELVHEIGAETLKSRRAFSAKMSETLKKARASKKPKAAAANAAASADTEAQSQPAQGQQSESPIAAARARRASAGAAGAVPSVPAPAHTAEATSVESDGTI